ncbi:ceramide transfer protein-like isoform X1 [Branchiostoma floridae]|uniref:Ceramide transfer protein n=1 Tax=Branchiostoma floridae TaxID=7739 RepID=A0A9J7KPG7_BRAFL|nr:ceramide transfer protein-like isoform X1 [Branchiostoma floridae]
MSDHSLNATDEEENSSYDEDLANTPTEICETLSKWTNYIHGWQDRYLVLKDGTLSYYKSENETEYGCRGSISLAKALIQPHEFDENRFDVTVNETTWYLRSDNTDHREQWVAALEAQKNAAGYGPDSGLRRHGSLFSVSSANLSTASTSSFKKGRNLKMKLAEMETFRDILCRQVDALQGYFDACATQIESEDNDTLVEDEADDENEDDYGTPRNSVEIPNHLKHDNHHNGNKAPHIRLPAGMNGLDFKGEAITFKATTAGIIATLSYCIDLMRQREDTWHRRLEKEQERRRRAEDAYKRCMEELKKKAAIGGPDYQEGPHSAINEEEFYDAVESALDRNDKLEEMVLLTGHFVTSGRSKKSNHKSNQITDSVSAMTDAGGLAPYLAELERKVSEHHRLAFQSKDGESDWQLLLEEGEMKVYRREVEEDGIVVDPLKAQNVVKGVTAHEICHYFWDVDIRMEWETTVEIVKLVEKISDDTVVVYQTHKRMWPTMQRDSLFVSSIRQVDTGDDEGPSWVVCNFSVDHPSLPVSNKCVRVKLNIGLVCKTLVTPPADGQPITRDDVSCKIAYAAYVNPGGWVPASVLRTLAKREYPRFLRKFSAYVQGKTKDKPIMF